jgi:hypothetical protein
VLRDVVSAVNSRDIDLPGFVSKMRLYAASAVMMPEDRARLQGMIQEAIVDGAGSSGHYTDAQECTQPGSIGEGLTPLGSIEPSESHPGHDFDKPPTGPGSPAVSPVRMDDSGEQKAKSPATIRLVSGRRQRVAAKGSKRSRVRTRSKPANLEAVARQAWASGATSVERLRRSTGMSRTAAASWVRTFKAEDAVRAEQTAQ